MQIQFSKQVRQLAKSNYLRDKKGAVINVNMSTGKYEILKVNVQDAIDVYAAMFG